MKIDIACKLSQRTILDKAMTWWEMIDWMDEHKITYTKDSLTGTSGTLGMFPRAIIIEDEEAVVMFKLRFGI